MPQPKPGKHRLITCSCGCNRQVTRWTAARHISGQQLESPPPPKRRRVAHSQRGQESLITRPGKREQSRTGNNSSTAHSRTDASSSSSDQPPFDFDPSSPTSPAGDASTEASGPSLDKALLDIYALRHRTSYRSDDEDSEDVLEEDVVEAVDFVDHETSDFWDGEDVAMEGGVDPREGIVSDWDLLTEKFIVEAEELGEFEHSSSHARLTGISVYRRVFYLGL
jgi:hypothetical protein